MKRIYPFPIKTPLQHACVCSNNDAVGLLLDLGADPYFGSKEIIFFEMEKRDKMKIFTMFEFTSTILVLSIVKQNFELTKFLLDRDIEDIDSDAFAIACYLGDIKTARLLASKSKIPMEKVRSISANISSGGVTQHPDVAMFLCEILE